MMNSREQLFFQEKKPLIPNEESAVMDFKKTKYLYLLIGFLFLSLFFCSKSRKTSNATDVYLHGKVITMDSQKRMVQAVALKDNKILAVGSSRKVKSLAGPNTRVVDLEGRTMMPGLYDAHSHFPGSGIVALYRVDLNSPPMGTMENIGDIVKALKKESSQISPGKWIVGRGYDDTLLEEKRHPSRYDLDKASTDHPIWIKHTSGHLGVANSRALEIAGVDKDTPKPEGGVIRKDSDGKPTGIFEEGPAMRKVTRHIPSITEKQWMEALKWSVTDYAEEGVTTVVIAGGGKKSVARLQKASSQGILPLRVISMAHKGFQDTLPDDFGNTMLKVGAVKLYQDGSIQGYTGYLSKPYHVPFQGDPTYRGYPIQSWEKLTERIHHIHRAGYQIAVHGNGDAAIGDIIHAFQEAQKEHFREDPRHRIEHCQMVREDQLDQIKKIGITPSFFVSHTYYWGDRHWNIFMGPERARRMSPLKSAVDRDIRFTIHCDTPVTPMDPLLAVWAAVNRISTGGKIIGREQRIPPFQALRAVTIDAAWQNFEEDIKGSIETGKLADLVILEKNPLEVDPLQIRDIQVLETIVGGKTVYKSR